MGFLLFWSDKFKGVFASFFEVVNAGFREKGEPSENVERAVPRFTTCNIWLCLKRCLYFWWALGCSFLGLLNLIFVDYLF